MPAANDDQNQSLQEAQSALRDQMLAVGRAARAAQRSLAIASPEQKSHALRTAARALRLAAPSIIEANRKDLRAAAATSANGAFLDRLALDDGRIEAMALGVDAIAELQDPVGATIATWTRPNGLVIERVRVPLGVIGVIYESRPNVTADAGALCLKAGNPVVLRGGSDSVHSSRAIHGCLVDGLRAADLPEAAIQLVATTDRAAVGLMLEGLGGSIDVIVPRGGKSLVARVQAEARVPVFAHLEGNCHVYVDRGADLEDAIPVILNAKLRRTGVCGAAETILIDIGGSDDLVSPVVTALLDAGCAVRGDARIVAADPRATPADEADWATEYLDAVIAAKTVDGVDEAIDHIARYGSGHTEAILTECQGTAERFLAQVDSAIVMHNASTQFADGGEFGMGAEIGIATGRMHARGPVGVEQLTTFKYVVRGIGQTRPK